MIVRRLFTLLGFKTDKKGFKEADRSLQRIKQTAIRIAGILVAGRVVKGIANIATSTAALADEVSKVADKLGVTTDALQEFRFAAELTGVPIRTADLALQRFTRRTAEAAKGTGEAKDALAELGVRLTDNTGRLRDVSDLLADAAEGLKNAKTQGDRLRLSFKLFDSEGAALVNTLKGGRDAFNAMAQAARETGGIFDEELIRTSVEFTDQQTKMKLVLQGIKNLIAKELLPFFIRVTNKTIAWVKANRAFIKTNLAKFIQQIVTSGGRLLRFMNRLIEVFNELPKASKLFLGVAAAVAVLSLVLNSPIALLLVILTLVGLIIEDFQTWQEGGDSLIGRLTEGIDDLTGAWGVLRDVFIVSLDLIKLKFNTLINIVGSFVQFIITALSGDVTGAFRDLGQQMRQVFEDVFDSIQNLVKNSRVLTFFFDFFGGGKAGKLNTGQLIQNIVSSGGGGGSRFVNPLFIGQAAGQTAVSQRTSNVFNIAGENADVIAGKIVEKIAATIDTQNKQTKRAFERRAPVNLPPAVLELEGA